MEGGEVGVVLSTLAIQGHRGTQSACVCVCVGGWGGHAFMRACVRVCVCVCVCGCMQMCVYACMLR